MPLHKVPEGSILRLPVVDDEGKETVMDCTFHHVDGMYSLITTPDNKPLHLAAMAPMKKIDDHYEIDWDYKGDDEKVV